MSSKSWGKCSSRDVWRALSQTNILLMCIGLSHSVILFLLLSNTFSSPHFCKLYTRMHCNVSQLSLYVCVYLVYEVDVVLSRPLKRVQSIFTCGVGIRSLVDDRVPFRYSNTAGLCIFCVTLSSSWDWWFLV